MEYNTIYSVCGFAEIASAQYANGQVDANYYNAVYVYVYVAKLVADVCFVL